MRHGQLDHDGSARDVQMISMFSAPFPGRDSLARLIYYVRDSPRDTDIKPKFLGGSGGLVSLLVGSPYSFHTSDQS